VWGGGPCVANGDGGVDVVRNFQRKISLVLGTNEYFLYCVIRIGAPVPEYNWSRFSSVRYNFAISSCW